MQKILYIAFCPLLISNVAFSNETLSHFRESFESLLQSSASKFDRAAEMKPTVLPLGSKMRKKDCIALVSKIKKNYKVNPFGLVDSEGGITNGMHMCGEPLDWGDTFIKNVSGKNQFGLPYIKVLQQDDKSIFFNADRTTLNFFLDENSRIVEVQEITLGKNNISRDYEIKSIDELGNVYVLSFLDGTLHISKSAQDRDDFVSIHYTPVDGSVPSPLWKKYSFDRMSKKIKNESVSLSRVDQNDWTDYVIPVTRGSLGGYYHYNGEYIESWGLNFKSELNISYKDGKEYCAYGSSMVSGTWVDYPENAKELQNDCYYPDGF